MLTLFPEFDNPDDAPAFFADMVEDGQLVIRIRIAGCTATPSPRNTDRSGVRGRGSERGPPGPQARAKASVSPATPCSHSVLQAAASSGSPSSMVAKTLPGTQPRSPLMSRLLRP